MTPEELKQLKPGDEIFIRAKYRERLRDGDVLFSHFVTNAYDKEKQAAEWYTHPENVISSISSPENVIKNTETAPKYDPCRKFKKGDIVDYHRRDGRDYQDTPDMGDYKFAVVTDDEDEETGLVFVEFVLTYNYDNACHYVPWYHLQLVTPVEELEPFFVYEDATSWQVKKGKSLCARYGKATHPHAKEAAEAECKRLNAEYRKEQNNG